MVELMYRKIDTKSTDGDVMIVKKIHGNEPRMQPRVKSRWIRWSRFERLMLKL